MDHRSNPPPATPGTSTSAAPRPGFGASFAAIFNVDHAQSVRHRRHDAPPGDRLAGQLRCARAGSGTGRSGRPV
jgi:hypothetical protein